MEESRSFVQVVAAIVRSNGKVLLVQEKLGDSVELGWSFPGGGVEEGELVHEALAREVLEETGIAVGPPTCLAFVVHRDSDTFPSAMLCAFEYAASDDLSPLPDDPSGKVVAASFVDEVVAMELMRSTTTRAHHEPAIEYLSGEVAGGAVWCYRSRAGLDDQITLIPGRRAIAER